MRKFKNQLFCSDVAAHVASMSNAMATDNFRDNRTDFRDESIYFMITTRFYDGDPKTMCSAGTTRKHRKQKDPCWRGDFQGVIDKLDYIKALVSQPSGLLPVVQNASGYDYHGYHVWIFPK